MVCWSLVELANKKQDELVHGDKVEAYTEIALELQYEPLGVAQCEMQLNEFRENPGTLEQRLWKTYQWQFPPEDETVQIWWICNLDEDDHTKEAKMICRRSLSFIRFCVTLVMVHP